MASVSEQVVLDFYLDLLEQDGIDSVRENSDRATLPALLEELKESGSDFHRKITLAKKIWKEFFLGVDGVPQDIPAYLGSPDFPKHYSAEPAVS